MEAEVFPVSGFLPGWSSWPRWWSSQRCSPPDYAGSSLEQSGRLGLLKTKRSRVHVQLK